MDDLQQSQQEEDIGAKYWSTPRHYRLLDFTVLAVPHLARLRHTAPSKLIDMLVEELANEILPPQLIKQLQQEAIARARERQQQELTGKPTDTPDEKEV